MDIPAVTTLEVTVAFIVLALVSIPPLKLVSRLRMTLGVMVVIRRPKATMSAYSILSYFLLVGFWLVILSAPRAGYSSLMFVRFFSAHWVTLVALMVTVTLIGLFDIVRGIYAVLYIAAWHETLWIFSLAAALGQAAGVLGFYDMKLLMLGAIIVAYYCVGFKPLGDRRNEAIVVLSMVVFDTVWYWMGFEVTVDNYLGQTNTIYYGSLFVNSLENWSWIVPCAVAIILALAFLLRHRRLSTTTTTVR